LSVAAPARRRRFPWLVYVLLLLLIVLVALAPVISVALAGFIAEANGCDLDEGSIHPCMVNGEDVGGTLYTMFVLGWFMLATLPMGAMALLVLLLALVVHLLWRHRRRSGP
jgi:di/tricarboxylate transporter